MPVPGFIFVQFSSKLKPVFPLQPTTRYGEGKLTFSQLKLFPTNSVFLLKGRNVSALNVNLTDWSITLDWRALIKLYGN